MIGSALIRKSLVFLLAGLVIGVFFGWLILASNSTKQKAPEIGTQVTDFSLPGVGTPTIRLSQYQGKAVILNFWATWCVPCKDEMPLLQKYSDMLESNLVVIGINSQEQLADVQAFANANRIRFLIALDLSGEVTRKFQVNGYPTSFFLDEKGILRDIHIGALREDLLKGYLQKLGVKP